MDLQHNDFVGFTFNNRHSSEFNIIRTSDGDRFDLELLPNQQNITANISNSDYSYFYDAFYDSRIFSIPIAYDNLTEKNKREIILWLSDKKLHDLIFDETPFKKYQAKISTAPVLNFIPFVENNVRVYKGEGVLQFELFFPYAKAISKTYEIFLEGGLTLEDLEWKDAANLLLPNKVLIIPEKGHGGTDLILDIDVFDNNGEVFLYNPGDVNSFLKFSRISVNPSSNVEYQIITYEINGNLIGRLILDLKRAREHIAQRPGLHFQINSFTKVIQGVEGDSLLSEAYNDIIAAGDFIHILPYKDDEIHTLHLSPPPGEAIDLVSEGAQIDYDYLYF